MKVTKRAWKRAAREYRDKYEDLLSRHGRLLKREIGILNRESKLIEQVYALNSIPVRAIRSVLISDLDICADCTGEEDCDDGCECICHDDPDAARATVAEWLEDAYVWFGHPETDESGGQPTHQNDAGVL